MEVSLNTDGQGFISQMCPSCNRRFKVQPKSPNRISHCPFCEHGDEHWFTPEQVEYLQGYAAREVLGPHLDKLDRQLRNMGSGSRGMFKVTGSVQKPDVPPKPEESDDEMPIATMFTCCGETIRHDESNRPAHCIVCGGPAEVA